MNDARLADLRLDFIYCAATVSCAALTCSGVRQERLFVIDGDLQSSAGIYTIAVDARGFKKLLVSKVTIHVGIRVRVNVTVEVGEIGETVTVTGLITGMVTDPDGAAVPGATVTLMNEKII